LKKTFFRPRPSGATPAELAAVRMEELASRIHKMLDTTAKLAVAAVKEEPDEETTVEVTVEPGEEEDEDAEDAVDLLHGLPRHHGRSRGLAGGTEAKAKASEEESNMDDKEDSLEEGEEQDGDGLSLLMRLSEGRRALSRLSMRRLRLKVEEEARSQAGGKGGPVPGGAEREKPGTRGASLVPQGLPRQHGRAREGMKGRQATKAKVKGKEEQELREEGDGKPPGEERAEGPRSLERLSLAAMRRRVALAMAVSRQEDTKSHQQQVEGAGWEDELSEVFGPPAAGTEEEEPSCPQDSGSYVIPHDTQCDKYFVCRSAPPARPSARCPQGGPAAGEALQGRTGVLRGAGGRPSPPVHSGGAHTVSLAATLNSSGSVYSGSPSCSPPPGAVRAARPGAVLGAARAAAGRRLLPRLPPGQRALPRPGLLQPLRHLRRGRPALPRLLPARPRVRPPEPAVRLAGPGPPPGLPPLRPARPPLPWPCPLPHSFTSRRCCTSCGSCLARWC
jgi:hypothetical protein